MHPTSIISAVCEGWEMKSSKFSAQEKQEESYARAVEIRKSVSLFVKLFFLSECRERKKKKSIFKHLKKLDDVWGENPNY